MDKQELFARIQERAQSPEWLFHGGMGLRITKVEDGYVEGEVTLEHRHKNPPGTVHGSLYLAMADTLGGSTAVTGGSMVTTVSSHMNFLSAPTDKAVKVIGKSRRVKDGRTIVVCEINVSDDTGRLLATALYEYMKLHEYTE